MAKTKLVCNLGLDDFFTLPNSSEVWRKKSVEPMAIIDASGDYVKRYKGYWCVSLYDDSKELAMKANERVELIGGDMNECNGL